MAGGPETERVDGRRQIEIVVDRLRHMHHVEAAGGAFLHLHRRVSCVITADRQEPCHVQTQKRDHHVFEILRIRCRIRTRDTYVRATAEVDAADGIDRKRRHMLDVALHQPLESVAHAYNVHAFERGTNCRSADDSVDAGGRSAPDQDGQFLVMFHASIIGWPASKIRPWNFEEDFPPNSYRFHRRIMLKCSIENPMRMGHTFRRGLR